MKGLKTRHWALHSHGALAGKSTFLAATARAPMIVVDTDGRFEAVEGLVNGPVYYPEQVIDSLTLAEELIAMHAKYKPASILWDSLTKLYSIHARLGYMRGRSGRKTADGKSINKAAELIEKSNAMTIARDMAILGTDMYYVWHTTSGVGGTGKSEIRDMISSIEKERLMTSVNVVLEFLVKGDNYGIMVVSARDFSGRKSNIGFTIWDKPNNYWSGAAERLERLIYTSFLSKEDAIKWGAERLSLEIDEAGGVYDHLRESVDVKTPAQMWVAWIEHVDDLVEKKISVPGEKTIPATVAQDLEKEELKVEESVAEQPTVEEVKMVAKAGLKMASNIQNDVDKILAEKPEETPETEEIQDEDPKERVADKPEDYFFDGELIDTVRERLKVKAGGSMNLIPLGDIIDSAAEAVPWKYPTPEDALARVPDFPNLPDSYKAYKEQDTTITGAVKIFDWLVFEG